MAEPTLLVVDPDEGFQTRIAQQLAGVGATRAVASLSALRADAPTEPVVVVLGPNLDTVAALRAFEDLQRHAGAVAGVLVVPMLDAGVMRSALRSGMADVVTWDASADEVEQATRRALSELPSTNGVHEEVPEATRDAKVVTVFSTKGGSGKSLVASNLAVLLAQDPDRKVALVDLNLQSGDLAIMLQLMPSLSMYDASQNIDRLDAQALSGYLTHHESGLHLLAAPLEPSVAGAVTAESVARILDLLKLTVDVVVIDTPAFFTDQVLAALDVSDEIVLVGSMDVPSVKNLRLALSTLAQLGHTSDQIRTVLNRADSNVGLRTAEVEKSLDARIDVQIPSNRDVPLSVNQGVPLAMGKPRSPVVTAIRELLDEAPAPEPASGRSLFGRRK